MKREISKFLLLIVTYLLLLYGNTYSQDPLSTIKSNSKLISELKDVFRAFHVNNIVIDQKEMINVLLSDGSDKEMKRVLDGYIKVCDALKKIQFNNDTFNTYVKSYLELTIQSYKIGQNKGFGSSEFKSDFEKYKKERNKYLDYLYSTYSTSHFIGITEEKYWQINEKVNYIKSADFETYKSLKSAKLKDALTLLNQISEKANNFQEYSIYKIEIADQYVKHPDILGDSSTDKAIDIYKSILGQNKYCIYFFESWLKWRTVTQQNNGLSKTSDIPNDEYDKVREQVALTILEYIIKNDKDEMAINEFLLMATHDIVKRFGDYPYGNQNTVEYHEIFDDKK